MTKTSRVGSPRILLFTLLVLTSLTARAEFSTDDIVKGRVKEKGKYPMIQMWEKQKSLQSSLKVKGKSANRKIARVRFDAEVSQVGCPEAGADLNKWRQRVIDAIIGMAPDKNAADYDVNHLAALDQSATLLSSCFPSTPACLSDLKRYATTIPHSVSTEPEYHAGLVIRSTKQLPTEFWVKDDAGNVKDGVFQFPPDLLTIAPAKGWKAAVHKTRGQGGFETGPNLLIVGIPGSANPNAKDVDIVMQIQLLHEDDYESVSDHYATEPKVKLSPVPLTLDQYKLELPQASDGGSNPGQEPNSYVSAKYPTRVTVITADHSRSPAVGQLRFVSRKPGTNEFEWKNEGDYSSCQSCHVTPFRNISPVGYKKVNPPEQRMTDAQEADVDGINDLMANFSNPPLSWGSAVRHTDKGDRLVDFGPPMDGFPLGWTPEGSTRDDAFIESCMHSVTSFSPIVRGPLKQTFTQTDTSPIRKDKVVKAMNCYSCHNGSYRGSITDVFSEDAIGFKLLVDRSMPPNAPADLTTEERLAVLGCLKAERTKHRASWYKSGSWLNGAACEAVQPRGSSSGGGTTGDGGRRRR